MTNSGRAVDGNNNEAATIEPWHPTASARGRRNEPHGRLGAEQAASAGAIILPVWDETEERDIVMLCRAMELNGMGGRLYRENRNLSGEAWYDGLEHIAKMRLEVTGNATRTVVEWPNDAPEDQACQGEQQSWQGPGEKVETMLAVVTLDGPQGRREIELPTDFAVGDPWASEPGKAGITVTRGSTWDVGELADRIRHAMFAPECDDDADSYETQEADFRQAAHQVACRLLLDETRATERIVAYAAEHLPANTLPRNAVTEIETGETGQPTTVRIRPRGSGTTGA